MRVIAVAVAMLLAVSANAQEGNPQIELSQQPCDMRMAASVYITEAGSILLNGQVTKVSVLQSELEGLRPRVQFICYGRANPEAYEPHPAALEALDAIMTLRLPIAFYWDSSFQQRVHFKE